MSDKESMHKPSGKKKVARATRKQTGQKKKKFSGMDGGGPGRPKGSTLDKQWGLTPRQMEIAELMMEVETTDGFFPGSVTALAKEIGADRTYVRELLRRDDFQKYINHLLLSDGIMLEMSFWRGMQLGLQVGDSKVLQLYAQMTGKIAKKEAPQLKVQLVSPDGSTVALPLYEEEEDIIDVDAIEEDD